MTLRHRSLCIVVKECLSKKSSKANMMLKGSGEPLSADCLGG